jgi:rubrerythrin
MKLKTSIVAAVTVILIGQWTVLAQPRRGAGNLAARTAPASPAAEQALIQALAGPDGEYAARAEYAAIVAKFGDVQPYASIINAEERHIAALSRHLEQRGLAVPQDPYAGKIEAPATLKEAAEAAAVAEAKNVALYEQLLAAAKDQPDLVRVFTHLQWASREHHLPALQAAAAKGGQLEPGESCLGTGAGQGRGGPPAWAGRRGQGFGQGACRGACGAGPESNGGGGGRGFRHGARQ